MKNNQIILAGLVTILSLGGLVMFSNSNRAETTTQALQSTSEVEPIDKIAVKTYKSPFCGCCKGWTGYMEDEGYSLAVEEVEDMDVIKERFDIPEELESCHTSEIEGYVVEGHVPEVAIAKLLAERPEIKGIALAGMPSGTPGMPGPKNEDYVVYEITPEGEKGAVFMTI